MRDQSLLHSQYNTLWYEYRYFPRRLYDDDDDDDPMIIVVGRSLARSVVCLFKRTKALLNILFLFPLLF